MTRKHNNTSGQSSKEILYKKYKPILDSKIWYFASKYGLYHYSEDLKGEANLIFLECFQKFKGGSFEAYLRQQLNFGLSNYCKSLLETSSVDIEKILEPSYEMEKHSLLIQKISPDGEEIIQELFTNYGGIETFVNGHGVTQTSLKHYFLYQLGWEWTRVLASFAEIKTCIDNL